MTHRIDELDFKLNNVPIKYVAFGEAIMLIGRKVNEIIRAINDLNEAKK